MLNRGHAYRSRVPPEAQGRLLSQWLAQAFSHSDARAWLQRIGDGEIELGGRLLTEDRPLRRGEELVWHRPPWEEPEVPRDFRLIHEDPALLVVDKPEGLPTMPAGGFLENTLLALVQARWPGAAPMHRLGRGTSGLVVFALGAEARSAVQLAWREGRVEKVYRALVQGAPDWEERVIEADIGLVEHPRLGQIHAAVAEGKRDSGRDRASRTEARVLRRGDPSVVELLIPTGRPHQIRIHMAFSGHPLSGDPLYGPGGLPRSDALPGDLGYTLRAGRLRLQHPITGRELALEAGWPTELR